MFKPRHGAAVFVLTVLAVLVFLCHTEPATFTGKVVAVTDGDTIKIMHKGKAEKVRLTGIDCPEKKQACGKRASNPLRGE